MVKKIIALTIVVFFLAGSLSVMAGGKSACGKPASGKKGMLQSAYDCISQWDKGCRSDSGK